MMVGLAIAVVAVAIFMSYIILKGLVKMLVLTKDNPVVGAWYTWVVMYGNPLEQVPTFWGLQDLVRELMLENGVLEPEKGVE